ncbi:MAG: hypothetical protein C0616_05390 [Desulfuromonas sp.]|nr:MAG: hypothetical protein C0616_05390 [Desulfuromonas sp.]
MECPVCHKKAHIGIDLHADGYAENLQECGDCGAIWMSREEKQILIYDPNLAHGHATFVS